MPHLSRFYRIRKRVSMRDNANFSLARARFSTHPILRYPFIDIKKFLKINFEKFSKRN